MTAQHASAPRKSALRLAGPPGPQLLAAGAGGERPPGLGLLAQASEPPSGQALRAMMISEFCDWLRSRTSKQKRPYQEETITAYKVAARALDAWMTRQGIEEDFSACDTPMLSGPQPGVTTERDSMRARWGLMRDLYSAWNAGVAGTGLGSSSP